MSKKAFTLIELMISIFMASLLSILIFDFYNISIKADDKVDIELCSALDLIFRDVVKSNKIYNSNTSEFVLKVNDNLHIGYKLKGDKLIRSEGQFVNGYWVNKIDSVVCSANKLSFEHKNRDRIKLKVEHENHLIVKNIRLRNSFE